MDLLVQQLESSSWLNQVREEEEEGRKVGLKKEREEREDKRKMGILIA